MILTEEFYRDIPDIGAAMEEIGFDPKQHVWAAKAIQQQINVFRACRQQEVIREAGARSVMHRLEKARRHAFRLIAQLRRYNVEIHELPVNVNEDWELDWVNYTKVDFGDIQTILSSVDNNIRKGEEYNYVSKGRPPDVSRNYFWNRLLVIFRGLYNKDAVVSRGKQGEGNEFVRFVLTFHRIAFPTEKLPSTEAILGQQRVIQKSEFESGAIWKPLSESDLAQGVKPGDAYEKDILAHGSEHGRALFGSLTSEDFSAVSKKAREEFECEK